MRTARSSRSTRSCRSSPRRSSASTTRQTALAVAILGKNGALLLPALREGAAGIEHLTERARETGAVRCGVRREGSGSDESDPRSGGGLRGRLPADRDRRGAAARRLGETADRRGERARRLPRELPRHREPVVDRAAARIRGGGVTVNVINNTGAQVSTEQKRDPRGGLTIDVIIDAVEQAMAQRAARPGTTLNRALAAAANPIKAR